VEALLMFWCGTDGQGYYPDRMQVVQGTSIRHTVRVVTPPVTEPVTIQEAKAQLHIGASDTSYDSELSAMIAAAREEWERDTSTALITRTLEHRLPRWLDVVQLTVRPVIAISSITYIDTNGDSQTVATADYYIDGDQVRFKQSFDKPAIERRSEAVRITYTAGYGVDVFQLPQLDRMAIKLSLANRFENRDDMMGGAGERKAYEALVTKKMRASYP
jgi:uncharacterized phiE125 gp8 family phage protein